MSCDRCKDCRCRQTPHSDTPFMTFSPPMAVAIDQCLKFETRRLIDNMPRSCNLHRSKDTKEFLALLTQMGLSVDELSPYPKEGEIAWIKEAFIPYLGGHKVKHIDEADHVVFKDGARKFKDGDYYPDDRDGRVDYMNLQPRETGWRHARWLPEWASRNRIKIIQVYPQRLQDMTANDVSSEGFWHADAKAGREDYYSYWNLINDPSASAALNPWVFVIRFELQVRPANRPVLRKENAHA